MTNCASPGSPDQPGSVVVNGTVTIAGEPVRGYVRLLDSAGEFVAEVPTTAEGGFTFHAVAGDWILRAITPSRTVDQPITAPLAAPIHLQL
jgi:hypothetical protein